MSNVKVFILTILLLGIMLPEPTLSDLEDTLILDSIDLSGTPNEIVKLSTVQINQVTENYDTVYVSNIKLHPSGDLIIVGFSDYNDNEAHFDASIGFVMRMTLQGEIIWTDEIAGDEIACCFNALGIDSQGNIIVAGQTSSTNLEITENAMQKENNGGMEIYIKKLSADGNVLWASYYGGLDFDCCAFGIVFDENDDFYFTHATFSFNYPTKDSHFDELYLNPSMALMEISSNGTLISSSIITGNDMIIGYLPRHANQVYGDLLPLVGYSFASDFPVSPNAFQTDLNGVSDVTLSMFNRTSQQMEWSTYLGGSGFDVSQSLFQTATNTIVFGLTYSPDFPLVNPLDNTSSGSFIASFNSTGGLDWSTKFGGTFGADIGFGTEDSDGNLLFTGITTSHDFAAGLKVHEDGSYFLTKISPDGSAILSNTILSKFSTDTSWSGILTDDNKLILPVYTNTSGVMVNNTFIPSYNYTLGGDFETLLIEYDLTTDEVSVVTKIIPQPDSDYDADGLSNKDEYHLCTLGPLQTRVCLDPLNPDMDGDGMIDGWEMKYSFRALIPDDPSQNYDNDTLTNLVESQYGTSPYESDTDNDGMRDDWEIEMGLDPLSDDAGDDKDGDGMDNLWEATYAFNANFYADRDFDNDSDKLKTWEEASHGTNPYNADSDNDGMDDFWEINNSLNATDASDRDLDSDGDFLPNYFEYQLRSNPQSTIELYYSIVLVALVMSSPFVYRLNRQRRNNKAKSEGWNDHKEKKEAFKAGFNSPGDRDNAKTLGFLTKKTQETVVSKGYATSNNMLSDWITSISAVEDFIKQNQAKKFVDDIILTKSPNQLLGIEKELSNYMLQLVEYEDLLQQMNEFQQQLILLSKSERKEIFLDIEVIKISEYIQRSSTLVKSLAELRTSITKLVTSKREWFAPWQPLLTLIQITEDGMPITLDKIVEVTGCVETQAEELIQALLVEYREIGTYDTESRTYTKGRDISDYLKNAMAVTDEFFAEN